MATVHRITLKRGSTFRIKPSSLKDGAGVVISLATYTISCAVKDKYGKSVATPVISINTGNNTFQSTGVSTSDWPTGELQCDLKFVSAGDTAYSQTIFIDMVTGVA